MEVTERVLRGAAPATAEAAAQLQAKPNTGDYSQLGRLLRGGLSTTATRASDTIADEKVSLSRHVPVSIEGWSFLSQPFSLPRWLSLQLADVCGGSETPSLVRQVLAWRDAGSSAHSVQPVLVDDHEVADPEQLSAMHGAAAAAVGPAEWRQLAAANARVDVALRQLGRLYTLPLGSEPNGAGRAIAEYDTKMSQCRAVHRSMWRHLASAGNDVAHALADVADAFDTSRRLLR